MWYLVNLPGNKLNIAVKTEKNSIAADCLNKVSLIAFAVVICALVGFSLGTPLLGCCCLIKIAWQAGLISENHLNRFLIHNENGDNEMWQLARGQRG